MGGRELLFSPTCNDMKNEVVEHNYQLDNSARKLIKHFDAIISCSDIITCYSDSLLKLLELVISKLSIQNLLDK